MPKAVIKECNLMILTKRFALYVLRFAFKPFIIRAPISNNEVFDREAPLCLPLAFEILDDFIPIKPNGMRCFNRDGLFP